MLGHHSSVLTLVQVRLSDTNCEQNKEVTPTHEHLEYIYIYIYIYIYNNSLVYFYFYLFKISGFRSTQEIYIKPLSV